MSAVVVLDTTRLRLTLQTPAESLAWVESLPPEVQREISPDWLARVRALAGPDPWACAFTIADRATGAGVGTCAFKGPPDAAGVVEIAYGIDEAQQRRGFATEVAAALAAFAAGTGQVRVVRAHTKAENAASARVLAKCGFVRLGEVTDPEDGLVDRWERPA